MSHAKKVQRIEDWDDARYAVTAPRAALDPRLTLIHFRLMSMLGRVNTRQGWCDMSQSAFAEALGYNRGSVVRAVSELVAWRYVDKRGQDETGGSRCHYRLLIDEPEAAETPGAPPADPAPEGECHVAGDTGGCHVPGDTGVTSHESGVSRIKDTLLDQRSKITPPNPQRGDAAPGGQAEFSDSNGKGEVPNSGPNARLLADLRADPAIPAPVMAALLEPVLSAKRFSDAAPAATLAEIARRARDLTRPALERAARELLDAKVSTLKADRVRAAIETSRKAGIALVVKPGMPEWAAWMRHWERTEPRTARIAAQSGSWMVASQWPPQAATKAPDAAHTGAEQASAGASP